MSFNCTYCNSNNIVQSGRRHNLSGTKQIFKCNNCQRFFSSGEFKKNRVNPEIIRLAVQLGKEKSLSEIKSLIDEKYSVKVSRWAIAKWLQKYGGKKMPKNAPKNDAFSKMLKNKKILITGGTGSLGKALAKALLNYDISVVRILDIDETAQFEMEQEFREKNPEGMSKLRFLVGDIKDKERLMNALKGIDIVFHLAALKHVKSCEYNAFEAVKTNVLGTQNIIEAALENDVEKVIFTSSDKAANPNNTMGATKLLAERLVTSANYYKGKKKTIFASVRFGNIIGSRGSVVPLFRKQILHSNTITITDPEMYRFMMAMGDAVNLVLECAKISRGGEIFILKMPVVKIVDLAEVMITEVTGKSNAVQKNVKISFIGPKEGETLYEELMTEEETRFALESKDMFIIPSIIWQFQKASANISYVDALPAKLRRYDTRNQSPITKDEIKILLHRAGALR